MESPESEEGEEDSEGDRIDRQISVAMEKAVTHLRGVDGKEEFLALKNCTSLDRFEL